MKTIRDLIKQDLRDGQIASANIVGPTGLDDPALLRVVVQYKNGRIQTIALNVCANDDKES